MFGSASGIDLDVLMVCRKVLMVCRKAADDRRSLLNSDAALAAAETAADDKVARFNGTGRSLSLNDVRIVVFSQVLAELCAGRSPEDLLMEFEQALPVCAVISQRLFELQEHRKKQPVSADQSQQIQASLF